MQFSEEFIDKWEHIIRDVDITEVPLECLKKIVIKLENRKQKTINVQSLKKKGHDSDDIEILVNTTLLDLSPQIEDIEFVVDVEIVAEIVQPATDKLLKGA
jgi:hypothetical protein